MGIWIFDEKERQSALNILQTLLSPNTSDTAQLKPISFTDLLGVSLPIKNNIKDTDTFNTKIKINTKPKPNFTNTTDISNPTDISKPTILDLLSKAKIRDPTDNDNLTKEIKNHFSNITSNANFDSKTSLKDFTNQICEFLRANPQVLASLHRDLIMNRSI